MELDRARVGQGVQRCAAHPARLAVDRCPRCSAPRCAADRGALGRTGCALDAIPGRQPSVDPEVTLVRAGLAGVLLPVLLGGLLSQYVGTGALEWVLAVVAGVAAGLLVPVAAGPARTRPVATAIRAVAVLASVLAVAVAYRLVPGVTEAGLVTGAALPAYLGAAAGAWLGSYPVGGQPGAAR